MGLLYILLYRILINILNSDIDRMICECEYV